MMLTPTTDRYIEVGLWKGSTETERKPDDPGESRKKGDNRYEIASQNIC